jgi:hypothetical protein
MRFSALYLVPLALAACGTAVPDSGAGIGFQDSNTYAAGQDGSYGRAQPIVTPGFSTDNIGAALDRADGAKGPAVGALIGATPVEQPGSAQPYTGSLDPNRPRGDAPSNIKSEAGEMTHASISDEQDFEAVKARETIESDKARIEHNREQYQVIQPGALPTRPGALGPNIVDYALSSTNPLGNPIYKRSSFGLSSPESKCASYTSPDLAQEAFLAKGGPEKDRLGIDPDGDGYACSWDPTPFRLR